MIKQLICLMGLLFLLRMLANSLTYVAIAEVVVPFPTLLRWTTPQAWTLEVVGSQVAFKGANGKYLSRCNGCWSGGSYPDSVFVHTPDRQPWSLWTPIRYACRKYLLKSGNGQFLARCDGCVTGNTNKFVFLRDPIPDDTWTQWNVD